MVVIVMAVAYLSASTSARADEEHGLTGPRIGFSAVDVVRAPVGAEAEERDLEADQADDPPSPARLRDLGAGPAGGPAVPAPSPWTMA